MQLFALKMFLWLSSAIADLLKEHFFNTKKDVGVEFDCNKIHFNEID